MVIDLSEIFVSIVGEGLLMGKRALFVRVSECNLSDVCNGYCDTSRLNGVGVSVPDECLKMSIENIVKKYGLKYVIFTGGEPLLYFEELTGIIWELSDDLIFCFQTNGTIGVDVDSVLMLKDRGYKLFFEVSPKRGFKVNDSFFELIENGIPVIFKLVVCPVEVPDVFDFPFYSIDNIESEVQNLISKGVDRDSIYLMPYAKSKEELDKWSSYVSEIALDLGVNYSDRLHYRVGVK